MDPQLSPVSAPSPNIDTPQAMALLRDAICGAPAPAITLGSIELRPHQRDAVRRLATALATHGGAVLADDPGMGKTYVALELARRAGGALVIAPAAVRDHWTRAASRAAVAITVESFERLSRGDLLVPDQRLLIVDEAQHVGARHTARRRRLERLCLGRRVLILSATPVRNREAEMHDLLALFLGRSASTDPARLADCVVRRAANAAELPAIVAGAPLTVPRTPRLDRAIGALPPAVPLRDGGTADSLVNIGLLRCRSSSIAALRAALLHRLQRGAALDAALAQGTLPNAAELRRWCVGDDTIQLQFALEPPSRDPARWREVLTAHCDAVRALLKRLAPLEPSDTAARADRLRAVLQRHRERPVLAFSQHAATVQALYHALRHEPHVALLTAAGARSASGPRARAELIAALEPGAGPAAARDQLRLLLATDLLSEGVNLQRAGVVVHLDLPWTPARLKQRIGRVARMGAADAPVHEYHFAASGDVTRALGMSRRLRAKERASRASIAPSDAAEALRGIVEGWPAPAPAAPHTPSTHTVARGVARAVAGGVAQAAVAGTRPGFLALIDDHGTPLIVGAPSLAAGARLSASPAQLARIAARVSLPPAALAVEANVSYVEGAQRAVTRFLQHHRAHQSLGGAPATAGPRRQLWARCQHALRSAPATTRAQTARTIARIRAALERAPAVGMDPELARLLDEPAPSEPAWLEGVARALGQLVPVTTDAPPTPGPRLVALLLIIPAAGARAEPPPAPGPRDAPTAASS